jgi:hypothetical protein
MLSQAILQRSEDHVYDILTRFPEAALEGTTWGHDGYGILIGLQNSGLKISQPTSFWSSKSIGAFSYNSYQDVKSVYG